ncbi:MAG: gamma-butyrobetaine hydroxylase-like domain-containing protein [Methylocella sp.]
MRDNLDQWPRELRLRENGRTLRVSFESGDSFDLSAEYLRVMSPSAEVQGHRREQRLTIGGKRQCGMTGIEPVGTYAVRLIFDDLHSTGIFTWAYLHELGLRHAENWAAYEAELQAKGLSRDRAGQA